MGYPGIGKTTLAKMYHNNGYIDLETSNFDRHEGWAREYCNVAEDLSRQGFIVLTGCHDEIREILEESQEFVVLIFPADNLKDKWIERLKERAERDGNKDKDLRALKHVEEKWEQDHEKLWMMGDRHNVFIRVITEVIFNDPKYIQRINVTLIWIGQYEER